MSDLAWTRLIDLVDVGYSIDCYRSTERFLYLCHAGDVPDIGLWQSGQIEPLGMPLWPENSKFDHSIGVKDDMRFLQFCGQFDPPSACQRRRSLLRELAITFGFVRALALVGAALHWRLLGQYR